MTHMSRRAIPMFETAANLRRIHHSLEVKGGTALAEHLMKTTEGHAVAVGQMKVIISVDANKPVCDTTAPTPPVTGYVSQGRQRFVVSTCFNAFQLSDDIRI